ncbi:MAG: flagellar hook-length control protein FliK [Pseudomonadota bacterium]
MMKAVAEKAMQMQVAQGQSGMRQALRFRMGGDQPMADFEGLLARQSAVHDAPLEKLDGQAADNRIEQAPRTTTEVLFMALAGGAEITVQEETPEPQDEDDSAEDGEPAKADEAPAEAVIMRLQPPAIAVEESADRPQIQTETKREKDAAPPARLVIPAGAALPLVNEKGGDDLVADSVPAVADDAPDSPAVAGRRNPKRVEEAPAVDKAARSQDGAPTVTLIRVAGQETHFAPSLAPMLGEQKIDTLPLNTPAGPDGPVRAQPAPPPGVVKMPNGPLRTLKVELGSQELGLVHATVAIKDKALDLRIGAVRDEAVAGLKENAGKLSDALQALGYSVDGVSVQKMQQSDAGNQTGAGQPMQQDAGGQDARGQGQQRTSGGSGSGSENSNGHSRHMRHDDHFAEQEGHDQPKSTAAGRNGRGVFL